MDAKGWSIVIGLICLVPLIITALMYGFLLLIIWLFGERVEPEELTVDDSWAVDSESYHLPRRRRK